MLAEQISHVIIANEKPDNWLSSIDNYCQKPIDKNQEQVNEVRDVAIEHQVGDYIASILYHSVTEEKE